ASVHVGGRLSASVGGRSPGPPSDWQESCTITAPVAQLWGKSCRCGGGGEGEIRTLDGPVTHNGFRDRRLQPLGHLSRMPGASKMAVPTGFEPAFSALTGPRVWPGYTTGPAAAKSTNGPNAPRAPPAAPRPPPH